MRLHEASHPPQPLHPVLPLSSTREAAPLPPDWNAVAALAAHLCGTPAALLLQTPQGEPPVLLGAHGIAAGRLRPSLLQGARAAAEPACQNAHLPAPHGGDGLQVWPYCEAMALPSAALPRTWLVWLGSQAPGPVSEPALQALLSHTASLLDMTLRHDRLVQQSQGREQSLDNALRESQNRLSNTLASITEAFVTLDREGRFTYLNPESERLLQKDAAPLLGQKIWHDLGGALTQRLRSALGDALRLRQRVELEDHCTGLGKWLEVRAYPFDEGLAVYFRDVTERRRSQEQLMLLETSVSRLNDIVVIDEAGADANA